MPVRRTVRVRFLTHMHLIRTIRAITSVLIHLVVVRRVSYVHPVVGGESGVGQLSRLAGGAVVVRRGGAKR